MSGSPSRAEWAGKDMSVLLMHLRQDTNFDADLIEQMLAYAQQAARGAAAVVQPGLPADFAQAKRTIMEVLSVEEVRGLAISQYILLQGWEKAAAGAPASERAELMNAYRALQNTLQAVPEGKFKRDMDDWLTAKLAATYGAQASAPRLLVPCELPQHAGLWMGEDGTLYKLAPGVAVPQPTHRPADVAPQQWRDAVRAVYLAARRDKTLQGIPSHWLEAMRDGALGVALPAGPRWQEDMRAHLNDATRHLQCNRWEAGFASVQDALALLDAAGVSMDGQPMGDPHPLDAAGVLGMDEPVTGESNG